MKNAVCVFLALIFALSLLLTPVFLDAEAGDGFAVQVATCAYHAHASVRLTLPHTLYGGAEAASAALTGVLPPFLWEPLRIPFRAVASLGSLFVELLRTELSGCEGMLPLS